MTLRLKAGRWLVPLGAVLCLFPGVSTGVGLLVGLLLAMTVGNPWVGRTRAMTRQLLAVSVVGLGAGMNLRTVARAGIEGLGTTFVSIVGCIVLGLLLARLLRVERVIGMLVAVGTAICGGSAIAAVVPILGAKEHETSVALVTVFLLNAVALFVFPAVGHTVGLDDAQFGRWAALAIHDTSSVVGAAVSWGGSAVELATTIKLARALWIVPLTLVLARIEGRTGARCARPWFIAGFVLASTIVTFVPSLAPAGEVVARLAKQLLVLTLFLIGANLAPAQLRATGWRPLALGVTLWLLVSGLSLALIVA